MSSVNKQEQGHKENGTTGWRVWEYDASHRQWRLATATVFPDFNEAWKWQGKSDKGLRVWSADYVPRKVDPASRQTIRQWSKQ